MKKLSLVVSLALVLGHIGAGRATAQLRANEIREENERRPSNTVGAMSTQETKGIFLGDQSVASEDESIFSKIFNMSYWSTHQSYSFSYSTNGPQSTGLSMFTNTFVFRPSENMMFSADVSAVYSPFSSFGSEYQKQINGIYLTNAQLDWKLGDNTFLTIQYSGSPLNQYGSSHTPWSNFDRFGTGISPTLISGQSGFGSNGWRTTQASITR